MVTNETAWIDSVPDDFYGETVAEKIGGEKAVIYGWRIGDEDMESSSKVRDLKDGGGFNDREERKRESRGLNSGVSQRGRNVECKTT